MENTLQVATLWLRELCLVARWLQFVLQCQADNPWQNQPLMRQHQFIHKTNRARLEGFSPCTLALFFKKFSFFPTTGWAKPPILVVVCALFALGKSLVAQATKQNSRKGSAQKERHHFAPSWHVAFLLCLIQAPKGVDVKNYRTSCHGKPHGEKYRHNTLFGLWKRLVACCNHGNAKQAHQASQHHVYQTPPQHNFCQ